MQSIWHESIAVIPWDSEVMTRVKQKNAPAFSTCKGSGFSSSLQWGSACVEVSGKSDAGNAQCKEGAEKEWVLEVQSLHTENAWTSSRHPSGMVPQDSVVNEGAEVSCYARESTVVFCLTTERSKKFQPTLIHLTLPGGEMVQRNRIC